ncbi:hypothetical protein CEXT_320241 [Caerostris extrusa]|uniref:Uncharacterized protein n=1 Tax=Caerostris extrusa TaxID=172846 RepID=A0AAV4WZF4_CAEEX|nr:hypothetical protein CEXT_320241 [Caerostris extrusa]
MPLPLFPRAPGNSPQSTTLPSTSAKEPLVDLALISNHPSCALVHRFSVLPEATLSHENELFATMVSWNFLIHNSMQRNEILLMVTSACYPMSGISWAEQRFLDMVYML